MAPQTTSLPVSVRDRFADRGDDVASRFEESSSFREICFDFDEVLQNLERFEPTDRLVQELKTLAADLEEEILSELSSGAGG